MFAVIRTGGKQYKVAKDDVITVERLSGEPGASVTLGEVLMIGDGADANLAPAGAAVTAEVVRQIKGVYKVRNAALLELYQKAQQLIRQLEWFEIGHVLRESNREADRLANEAMDRGQGRTKV